MQRAVTAIYQTAAVADLVRADLERLGIARHNITVLPDTATLSGGADAGLSTGTGLGQVDDALDRLHDLYLPEDDARTYQQALRNGDYVVSVEVGDDADLTRVQEVMRRPEDAYDLDELDTRYSTAEYTPRRPASGGLGATVAGAMGATGAMGMASTAASTTASTGTADLNDDGTVKVVEENLAVGKREVEEGAVRVRSFVREQPVQADVQLRSTRVFVERHPVNRPVGPGDLNLQDRVLEAHETAEQAVVAKEARVVEEIGLRQESEVHTETIQDTVRRTEVEVEDERTGEVTRITGDGTSGTTGSGSTGSGRS